MPPAGTVDRAKWLSEAVETAARKLPQVLREMRQRAFQDLEEKMDSNQIAEEVGLTYSRVRQVITGQTRSGSYAGPAQAPPDTPGEKATLKRVRALGDQWTGTPSQRTVGAAVLDAIHEGEPARASLRRLRALGNRWVKTVTKADAGRALLDVL